MAAAGVAAGGQRRVRVPGASRGAGTRVCFCPLLTPERFSREMLGGSIPAPASRDGEQFLTGKKEKACACKRQVSPQSLYSETSLFGETRVLSTRKRWFF